jgi:hypothetical protein
MQLPVVSKKPAVFAMQRLDRRKRDAVLIDRSDVAVVDAGPECGVEILRHRAEVTDARIGCVAPCVDWKCGDFGKYGIVIERSDIGLRVAIAQACPRAFAGRKHGAGRRTLVGVDRDAARRANHELILGRMLDVRRTRNVVAPYEAPAVDGIGVKPSRETQLVPRDVAASTRNARIM